MKKNLIQFKSKEYFEDKKVLITGSNGFLGSSLLYELKDICSEIRLFNRNKQEIGYTGDNIFRFYGDIRNPSDLKNCLTDIDIVYHFAAIVNIDESIRAPRKTMETNIIGTLNLLELAKQKNNEPHIIFSSSADVYSSNNPEPITERSCMVPDHPYSASKCAADFICQSYIKTYNLPITILRPTSLYGPRQRNTQFIPTVITQCLQKKDLHLGPLDNQRDFIFIKDIIYAMLMVGYLNEAKGRIYNLSSEKLLNLNGIVHKIMSYSNNNDAKIIKKTLLRSKYEKKAVKVSSKEIKTQLGWKATTGIDEGLQTTIRWFKREIMQHPIF